MDKILPCIPLYLCPWRIWNSAYRPPRSATISSNLELFILSEIPSSVFHSSAQHPEVAPEVEVEREFPAQFNMRINIHRARGRSAKKALHYWVTNKCTCIRTFASHFEPWEKQIWWWYVRLENFSSILSHMITVIITYGSFTRSRRTTRDVITWYYSNHTIICESKRTNNMNNA